MSKKMRNIVIVFIGIIFIVGLFVNFRLGKHTSNIIKVGAVLPLTGSQSYFGKEARNGLELSKMYVTEHFLKKGKRIEIIYADNRSTPKGAVDAANKLLSVDNVKYVISLFPFCPSVNSVTKGANVLHFAATMNPNIYKPENTIRIYPSEILEAQKMAEYCNSFHPQRIAILHLSLKAHEEEVNEYLIPYLKKGNKDVKIMREVLPLKVHEIRSVALKIKDFDPDILVLILLPHYHYMVFKGLDEVGVLGKTKIIGNISFLYKTETPQSLLEGVVFVAPTVTLKPELLNSEFKKKYKEVYGSNPTIVSSFLYDNLLVLGEALSKTQDDPVKVKEYILKKRKFKGVTGEIEILPTGDSYIPLSLGIIRNAKRIPLENLN